MSGNNKSGFAERVIVTAAASAIGGVVGAMVGSIFGPIGTIAGGKIGSVIGAAFGGSAASDDPHQVADGGGPVGADMSGTL